MTMEYKLKGSDLSLVDVVFEMGDGYVLDFSNRTFSEFFNDEMQIDIYSEKYGVNGNSKAKRLRTFLRISSPKVAANLIVKLWNYREKIRKMSDAKETLPFANAEIKLLVANLRGKRNITKKGKNHNSRTISELHVAKFKDELLKLSELSPQKRGFEFEKFLNKVFREYGMNPRDSFRIKGEQIDGSFELDGETYLLEAKWQNSKVGSSDLYAFNGKVSSKSNWTRGLFVSFTGFSEDGMSSFRGPKSIICMDGLDLHNALETNNLPKYLRDKIRLASETGDIFASQKQ